MSQEHCLAYTKVTFLNMGRLILILCFVQLLGGIICSNISAPINSTDTNKDMYVIHAMVYQVGILTNRTDDEASNGTMGNQESLTFYHTNGSKVDLSNISAPLLTNVTAQSMIQVAPKSGAMDREPKSQISWSALKDMASLPDNQPATSPKSENGRLNIARRSTSNDWEPKMVSDDDGFPEMVIKRSVDNSWRDLFKRELPGDKSVKVVKGAAMVPPAAGVQSVALPPLLALNSNLSDIPVPIPNTSVVHYAKINTLIRKP